MSGKAIGGARCNGNEDGRSEVVGDDVEHLVAAKAAQGVPGTGSLKVRGLKVSKHCLKVKFFLFTKFFQAF